MAELPLTFRDLIGRLRRLFEDYPQRDSMGADQAAATSVLTVDNPSLYSIGTKIEIEDELMLVTAEPSGSILTLQRGYGGTTAAAHTDDGTIDTYIYIDPRFVRANYKEAINTCLDWMSIYMPKLVWDTTTAGNMSATRYIYAAPADATGVQEVTWQEPGYQKYHYLPHGPLKPYPTSIVSTGVGVEVYEVPYPGRAVHMLVEKPWGFLSAMNDTLTTPFPETAIDLLLTGAALYLMGWKLIPKLRPAEIAFYRETATAMPPNISLGRLEQMKRDWIFGMQRVAKMRPGPESPKKVFR